jgi:hypothetical protein
MFLPAAPSYEHFLVNMQEANQHHGPEKGIKGELFDNHPLLMYCL